MLLELGVLSTKTVHLNREQQALKHLCFHLGGYVTGVLPHKSQSSNSKAKQPGLKPQLATY